MISQELVQALCVAGGVDPNRVKEIRMTPRMVDFVVFSETAARENPDLAHEVIRIPVCRCTHEPDLVSVAEHEENVDGRG